MRRHIWAISSGSTLFAKVYYNIAFGAVKKLKCAIYYVIGYYFDHDMS